MNIFINRPYPRIPLVGSVEKALGTFGAWTALAKLPFVTPAATHFTALSPFTELKGGLGNSLPRLHYMQRDSGSILAMGGYHVQPILHLQLLNPGPLGLQKRVWEMMSYWRHGSQEI
jgi:hypothetical protein